MLDLTKPWNELPLVVIDFETTGPDPETCQPVEVAAVRFEGGKVVAEFSSLLDPGCSIPEEATKVHGITDEMVTGKPTLLAVAPQLFELAQGAAPVAYNAPFDRAVLHRFVTGNDCPAFDPTLSWIDVFVVIASPKVDKYTSGPGRLKLGAACKRWGIELDGAHRATADCKATGALLFRLLERGAVKSVPLGKLLEHTDSAREAHEADHAQFRKRILAEDRVIWRQYACAALAGALESVELGVFTSDAGRAEWCGKQADALLALEKARFVGGTK